MSKQDRKPPAKRPAATATSPYVFALRNTPIRTAEGRKLRDAFAAVPGVRLDVDYAALELRLAADWGPR